MLAAGFRAVFKHDFEIRRDLSNPSDDVVKYIQLVTDHRFNESQVRAAIDDVHSQPSLHVHPKKTGDFYEIVRLRVCRGEWLYTDGS